jgi:hypothetical protein
VDLSVEPGELVEINASLSANGLADSLEALSWGATQLRLTITARDAQGSPVNLYLVPEPGALSLLVLGGAVLALLRRYRSAGRVV